MNGHIERLKLFIEETERCRATHIQSLLVKERLSEDTPVERMVETFDLHNHPNARRAYAWERWNEGERADPKYTVVLGIPPVNSANDAVKAAIMAILKSL